MEQLVRGSVPWTHPALQPRAPAWHKLSVAAKSFGLTRAGSDRREWEGVGDWSLGRRKIPQNSCFPRGFCNLKTSQPYPNLFYPLSIEISRQDHLGHSHWHGHALGLSVSTGPPSPAHCPQACHAPNPLPGPCCRARLFLLIHALELWGRGLELGTKFRLGGAGRQPGIHTRCTRNAQAECLAFESPGEAAQPPCLTSLPSSLWSLVLSSQSQEPLLTFPTLDLLPSSLFPDPGPQNFFQLGSLGRSQLG